jgi:hypothetical protein
MHERLLTERCQQEVEITPRRLATHCGPQPIHRGINDLMFERYSHTRRVNWASRDFCAGKLLGRLVGRLHGGPGFVHTSYKPAFSTLADVAQNIDVIGAVGLPIQQPQESRGKRQPCNHPFQAKGSRRKLPSTQGGRYSGILKNHAGGNGCVAIRSLAHL